MSAFKLILEYDGTDFSGWQLQKHGRTVQGEVQEALKKIFGTKTTVIAAGRTDAGVHAKGQAAVFRADTGLKTFEIVRALNTHLPQDVKAVKCSKARDGFHPQHDALSKRYEYTLYTGSVPRPLYDRYAARYPYRIDMSILKECALLFTGTRDFYSFCAHSPKIDDYTRTIYDFGIKRKGLLMVFSVEGSGFLYKMVRILCGAALAAARGAVSLDDVRAALDSKNKLFGRFCMPSRGLCLLSVRYQ